MYSTKIVRARSLINMISSAEFIELIVGALPTDAGQRDESILREALQRLVKVARLEQLQAIENDFDAIDNLINLYRRPENKD